MNSQESVRQWFADKTVSGWVAVHGPSVRSCFSDLQPGNHEVCVAELSNHFVFAASDKKLLPVSPESLIVEFTTAEANMICQLFLGKCHVFVTRSQSEYPQTCYMLRYDDWLQVLRLRQVDDLESCEPIRAMRNDLSKRLGIEPVIVNARSLLDWKSYLFNTNEDLASMWSRYAGQISQELLAMHRNHSGVNEEVLSVGKPIEGLEARNYFVICHLFKYWTDVKWEARVADLAELKCWHGPLTKQYVHAEAIRASCVRPSRYFVNRRFASMRSQADFYVKLASAEPPEDSYGLLLSVLFPDLFSAQFEHCRPIRELTLPARSGR